MPRDYGVDGGTVRARLTQASSPDAHKARVSPNYFVQNLIIIEDDITVIHGLAGHRRYARRIGLSLSRHVTRTSTRPPNPSQGAETYRLHGFVVPEPDEGSREGGEPEDGFAER